MPLFATAHLNFGYPWWLSYGHLPIVLGAVSAMGQAHRQVWTDVGNALIPVTGSS